MDPTTPSPEAGGPTVGDPDAAPTDAPEQPSGRPLTRVPVRRAGRAV